MSRVLTVLFAVFTPALLLANDGASPSPASAGKYEWLVLDDAPVAYWRFSSIDGKTVSNSVSGDSAAKLTATVANKSKLATGKGPSAERFPLFESKNPALVSEAPGYLSVADPGEKSSLDFDNGDRLTVEAWVNPSGVQNGQQVYVVGKGRTSNPGVARENQNFALRLRGVAGTARVSFLFRDAENRPGHDEDFHRWTSQAGFVADGDWHHVAVVYEFGKPESIAAYIDGQPTAGGWDMGGPTAQPPVVDNDDLWIGSALAGNAGNTFRGRIDEVAIYRSILSPERIGKRYEAATVDERAAELAFAAEVPTDAVAVSLYEGISTEDAWPRELPEPSFRYTQPSMAFIGFPKKYTSTGVIDDRSNPFLLRARVKIVIAPEQAGDYELVLRSKGAARLYLDGVIATQTNFLNHNASGHEAVPELASASREDLRPLPAGCQEQFTKVRLAAGEHLLRLDAFVGGKSLRLEIDELCIGLCREKDPLQLAATGSRKIALTEAAWQAHSSELQDWMNRLDAENRLAASVEWRDQWRKRHEFARKVIASKPAIQIPAVPSHVPVQNDVDRFVGTRLVAAGTNFAPRSDDFTFLRRAFLDATGVVPTRAEIAQFLSDASPDRRSHAIDRLLADSRWADHWVSYWQDVLAENPGILKPELNNTGPFRWWIYESLLDNKPFDQFATELVLMQGSTYYGGPAGFGMATQNDVPMAAKAHVLAKAFLAMDLTCARCHDAPYHPFKQQELFSVAAMLNRKPIKLPATSTVPQVPGARRPLVTISLQAGQTIAPAWPFGPAAASESSPDPAGNAADTREQVALELTSPHNDRFAKVLVNRVWQRLMGRGLIEPVDDWESNQSRSSHPELLDYLAREFAGHDYDVKHIQRLIMNSHAYQRAIVGGKDAPPASLFASPVRRRMSAEQLVDSLFAVSGKPFRAERLTLDPEGRRPADSFLNLGDPRRAWQFTSLSNERDRPALALPVAQSVVDLLVAFGWRDARPHPLTNREEEATALQPLSLANGIAGNRTVRLSDDSRLTELSLQEIGIEQLVEEVFLQVLSRPPTGDERTAVVEMLAEGYELRRTPAAARMGRKQEKRMAVSWSNHLSAEATRIKQDLEREVRAGDPPTDRLQSQWRERMEDVVWALVNSPEFVFIP